MPTLADGPVRHICVGAFWTAVAVEVDGVLRCGLASTLRPGSGEHGSGEHGSGEQGNRPAVLDAGGLAARRGRELAALSRSARPMEVAIGTAAINALLLRDRTAWADGNAEEVIAAHGAGKNVAVVGHFPFTARLREQVGRLWVLELMPQGDDLPAAAAADVVPRADVLAITSTALMNRTFDGLMALRRPAALVLLLGPSTPLSPVLFRHGVDLLSGSLVEDVDAVLHAVSQGGDFRQVHRHGVRLVTMGKGGMLP